MIEKHPPFQASNTFMLANLDYLLSKLWVFEPILVNEFKDWTSYDF